MQDKNKRIIKNTGFLYFRMLFLMVLGFFTTRKVLEALGVQDLGIYNVVGSLVIMFDFVSSGLSNATQRFISIGLGSNNIEKSKQYFSQSLIVHIAFVVIIAVVAETLGLWFVKNKLIIPIERLDAAISIWHISVILMGLRFVKICYESDIIARENMSIYSYLSIVEGLGKLLVCYIIINCSSFDKLVLYGTLLLLLNLIVTVLIIVYCSIKYEETHVRFYSDSNVYNKLISFIGLNSLGVISWSLGKQGLNVVLNMFFGPIVNGAKGLASQLEGAISQFATNINVAVRPQITQLYAQGKLSEMMELAHRSTKYILYIVLIISIPFLFQTREIISIWLGEVPDYTILFVQILMFEILANMLGNTYDSVSIAIGKIRNIQVYGRLITLAGLPISYIVLKIWEKPYLPLLIMAILTLIYSLFILYDINRNLRFGLRNFVRIVVLPMAKVVLVSFILCSILSYFIHIENDFLSLFVSSMLCCGTTILTIVIIGLNQEERRYIVKLIKKKRIDENSNNC